MADANHMIGEAIVASARLGLGYADRLLTGVDPSQFARFANVGGTTVESNHPCFILGHLSLYPSRIVSDLGGDASSIQATAAFDKAFSKDAKCVDDTDGTIYPAMGDVVDAFRASHELAIDTLLSASDDLFYAENPNEAMRGKFPTVGAMHAFYVSGHLMVHMGQFSAWRRMMGMGAA